VVALSGNLSGSIVLLSKRQNFLEPQFTAQTERAIPANAKNWSANAMGINAR
jgi:hypothetical protein